MARTAHKKPGESAGGATVGYEAQLWQMADALRGSMDAAEYKHVTLGLLFLKYISDAFEEKHAALLAEKAQGADPEDPDEYRAQGIFWVPPEARWPHLKAQARQSTIGQLVDDPMSAGRTAGNANFAWVQHIVHHLAPAGVAGFVLANGSMSSNQSGEGEIRRSLSEAESGVAAATPMTTENYL